MIPLLLACHAPAADSGTLRVLSAPPQAPIVSDCGGSCALPGPPAAGEGLGEREFLDLLAQWSAEPLGEPTLSLETLLFHGPDTAALLALHPDQLSPEREVFLRDELARSTVRVAMRLVDEDGAIRGTLDSGDFPLKAKQHLAFADTGSLGWLETGGKVKRVGLGHLWSRW